MLGTLGVKTWTSVLFEGTQYMLIRLLMIEYHDNCFFFLFFSFPGGLGGKEKKYIVITEHED